VTIETITIPAGAGNTWIYLTIYDKSGAVLNFCANDIDPLNANAGATVTWALLGTSISKTTADNTIFSAHPVMSVVGITQQPYVDTNAPCFIIRIFKDEIATLDGTYWWKLAVTNPVTDVTSYFGGTLNVGAAEVTQLYLTNVAVKES
jgi:hypothetical protein